MKKYYWLLYLTLTITYGQKGEHSELLIPPKQIVQINYPLYKGFTVKIWNKSKLDVTVSARDRVTDTLQKRFGLEKGGVAELEIYEGAYLQFENSYLTTLKVAYSLAPGIASKKKGSTPLTPQRAFYLENNTAQSIPLLIPGVMNPNLSPFSRSGVDLPNGQEVFLNLNGKRILILTVRDSIPHGARIDVATLIEKALNQP